MSLSKVIETARGELGQHEDPAGSNLTKYGFWYGVDGVPWCVIFLCWLFNQAGERMAFFGGGKTASCSMLLRWYKEQGLTVPVEQVQTGDIVILDFSGRQKDTQHCGIVTKTWWGPDGFDRFETIEGNTTNGAGQQDNGGAVCEKIRYPSQIVAVCRPTYQPEKETVDDVTGHWAYKDIQWAKEKGLLRGYADGSMRPDQPVTRAELAVILRRYAKE
jgi:hypothetical protein